jgi:phage-related protein
MFWEYFFPIFVKLRDDVVRHLQKNKRRKVSKFRNFFYLCKKKKKLKYFETRFLEEADKFISKLDAKSVAKVLYNVDIAEQTNDPKLFKKLLGEIWEFRTKYLGKQIRLLAFWDKTDVNETLVLATHGFIKKVDKVPANEIERAKAIRKKYFENKPKI